MADLHITGSGGIEIVGHGIVGRAMTPTAVVGAGGVNIAGTGVIAYVTPGIMAVVGAGGVEIAGDGVVTLITPVILAIIGDGGIIVGGRGVVGAGPFTFAYVGSGGIQVGGAGVVAHIIPAPPPVLAVVGAGGIAVGGAGVVGRAKPSVLAVIGSGGIQIGEFRVPELTVVRFIMPADLTLAAIVGSGGVEIGGHGIVTQTSPPALAVPPTPGVADADVLVGGAGIVAFIHPKILQVIGDGEVIIGGAAVDEGVYETYVLTGTRGEPSVYSGFSFNSYAHYRGQYFGAGPGGIYLLEGEDDAGAEIHPGVRIGPVNFGTDREKRLRLVRCGGQSTGAQVRVSSNGKAGFYDVEGGRAAVSREIQGRELTIEILDFETLDHLEIVPLVLMKR
jgi:hypothetical protein